MTSEFFNQPHRRLNPLTREWVLVSPHRTQRPWQGQVEKPQVEQMPAYDPQCYLCPGNMRAGGNQTPKYGEGGAAYARRLGAALADFGTQNFFSAGVLATLLHQDPRYYRKGPGSGVARRAIYSVSRLVIARQDSGAPAFNASGIGGMMLGIAASNLYYPAVSVRGSVMACRVSTSLSGGIMGNLMSEFWPDLQKRFFHKRHSGTSPEKSQSRPGPGTDSHE